MKQETRLKLKVITSNSVTDLENKVNQFFAVNKIKSVNYDKAPLECTAFINYEETINVPESIKDEYNLNGIFYCCGDCPYWGTNFKEATVENRTAFKCFKGIEHKSVRATVPACQWFYESIARGDFRPYDTRGME